MKWALDLIISNLCQSWQIRCQCQANPRPLCAHNLGTSTLCGMVPNLLGGQNSCQPVAIQCRSINWHSCGLAQLKPIGSQSEASYVSNHRTSPLYGCKEVSQRRMIWTKPVVPYHYTKLHQAPSPSLRSHDWLCIVIWQSNPGPIANGGLCNKLTIWTVRSVSLEHDLWENVH